jgi:hypothetical protein
MVKTGTTTRYHKVARPQVFDSADSLEEAETKAIVIEPHQSEEEGSIPSAAEVASTKSGFDPKRQEIFFERSRQFEVPNAADIPLSLFD